MTADRVELPDLWRLTWSDVDPAARPTFDPAGAPDLVRSLPPAAEVPPPGSDWRLTDFWYDRMTAALVERLGVWVVGLWHTVAMEDYRDRGVIPVWRTRSHPVLAPAEMLTRIAEALVAWHELLVELATDARGRFAAAAPAVADGAGEPPAWRAVQSHGRVTVFTGSSPRRRLPHPADLSWAEADPAKRDFEPGTVPTTVADLVAAAGPPSQGADWRLVELWLDNLTAGLVDRYGQWVVGWRWSHGEADLDGGPVGSWCCFSHSVTTPEATAVVITSALVEWHDWLGELADRFGRFLPLPADDLDGWERAVAHLVTAVGDSTQYDSGWYFCCRTALGWFLDAAGIDATRHERLLDHAIGGRFESWTEPPREVVVSVAERLAGQVTGGNA